jgi:hypothetical protein
MTQREANELINSVKRRQHKRHDKIIPKRAYECTDGCPRGTWHTTHLAAWEGEEE